MNLEFKKIATVYHREMVELRSSRSLAVFGLFAILQCLLMIVNKAPNRVENSFMIFMLGGFVGVLVCFDMITKEREHHTMDLLLTQGITRRGLFLAKWLATLSFCVIGGAAALCGGAIGSIISGKSLVWGDWLAEFIMAVWLLSIYGVLSLMYSATAKRGKWALIAASVTWFMMRPAILGQILLGPFSNYLGWSKSLTWHIAAWMPEFAFRLGLDIQRVAPDDVYIEPWLPYLVLSIYLVVLSLSAWLVFRRQDEPVV